MDDFDKTLDVLFAALPAIDAGEQLPDDAPFRRIEMDFGADTAWFEGAFEGETAGFPAGKGPRPVYLVLDGPAGPALGCFVDPDGFSLGPCTDADGNEVAALLVR